MAVNSKKYYKLEDIAKLKQKTEKKKKLKKGEVYVKNDQKWLEIQEIDFYDLNEAMAMIDGNTQDVEKLIQSNCFIVQKGCVSYDFNNFETQKAFGVIDPIEAIKKAFTMREIFEIATSIINLNSETATSDKVEEIKKK